MGFLSILRVIGALSVVLISVISSGTWIGADAAMLELIERWMMWAVPVFFLITGAIFLGTKKECSYRSIWKYVIRFLTALFLLGLIYSLLQRAYLYGRLDWSMVWLALRDVVTGNSWDHLWYVYEAIGIYLILPVLKAVVKQDRRSLNILCLLSFFFTILLPVLSRRWNVSTAFTFPMGGYVFYVLMGGKIASVRKHMWYVLLSAAGLIISVVLMAEITIGRGMSLQNGYRSWLVCMMAVSIFTLFAVLFDGYRAGRNVSELASLTWGIYLLHPIFLYLAVKVFGISPYRYHAAIAIPLTAVLLFGAAGIVTWIFRQIPVVRKLF